MIEEECACIPSITSRRNYSIHKASDDYSQTNLPNIIFKPIKQKQTKNAFNYEHHQATGKLPYQSITFRRKNCSSLIQPNQCNLLTQRQTYNTRNYKLLKSTTYDNTMELPTPVAKNLDTADCKISPLAFEVTSYNTTYKPNMMKSIENKKKNSAKLTSLKVLWKQKEYVDQQIHILQVQKSKLNEQIQKASAKLITEK